MLRKVSTAEQAWSCLVKQLCKCDQQIRPHVYLRCADVISCHYCAPLTPTNYVERNWVCDRLMSENGTFVCANQIMIPEVDGPHRLTSMTGSVGYDWSHKLA